MTRLQDLLLSHPAGTPAPVRQFSREEMPDCLWPSDNPLDIPVLRTGLMGNTLDLPCIMWGTVARRTMDSQRRPGTLGFYVDDYRFQALWKDPSALLNSGARTIIEPNYSVHERTPVAVATTLIYRKRWLARLCQEFAGMRVFVDLNVALRHMELNMLGVPEGWRAWSTRFYVDSPEVTDEQYARACEHCGDDDVLFVVYGGGRAGRAWSQAHQCIHITDQRTQVRREGRELAILPTPLKLIGGGQHG